ncbi:MAG: hypothetical protein LGL72_00085 [Acidibrevibacterium sp.]|uniref:hypothetical protein n=1 Tax=Acidibrevibacterium fodinaquatile TaxID=1969806 RepID=UPI0023A7B026|nr:hypothetical protein [Acidibrevibacterium fodinaquatile]MCA7117843.1 hypothetical protein [Acidibrevibacterium fodinaquatile]
MVDDQHDDADDVTDADDDFEAAVGNFAPGLLARVGTRAAGIPLNLLQKWLGHAQLTTTAIYANATGAEEKNIASKMWE